MELEAQFCREVGLAVSTPQHGSAAAGVTLWLALEHDGPWASKAWEAAEIPAAVRAHVDRFVQGTPGVRLQLIRREGKDPTGPRTLLLASVQPGRSLAVQFELADLEAVVGLDLGAAAAELQAGRVPERATPCPRPVALVCTNGKRDRCCAKWGQPVYAAMAADARIETWQTTHLGGHRFAATLVWLPDGLCHGRVPPEQVEPLISSIVRGEVGPLELIRGRTCLPEAAQAAEVLCRQEQALSGQDDVIIEGAEREGERWRVLGRVLGQPVSFAVQQVPTGATAPASCGKPAEPVMRWAYAPLEAEQDR